MNKSFYSSETERNEVPTGEIIYNKGEHKVFYKGNIGHGLPSPAGSGNKRKNPGYAAFTCEVERK